MSSTAAAQARRSSPGGGGSERARLATLAREAALTVPGVLRAERDALGAYLTRSVTGELLDGVSASATSGGGYAVSLRLVAALVPLPALGERVAERVHSAAAEAGLDDELESVSVRFTDVEDDGAR
jgi:hypothetical protein